MEKEKVSLKAENEEEENDDETMGEPFGANTEEASKYQSFCGVVVMGAPGTGKTTFCRAFQEFLGQLERKHAIVNLDPANENMEYKVIFEKYD